jgi:hypothetical protein
MRGFLGWCGLAVAAAVLPERLLADSLLIAGAGFVGRWDTELDIANVSDAQVDVRVSILGLPLAIPCPPNCTEQTYPVPARGTITVRASDFLGAIYPGPQMVRVEALEGAPLPVVHARAVGGSDCEFAELPVVRDTSAALAAGELVFPGVARGGGRYSNLILEVMDGPPATAQLELFDGTGHSFGPRVVPIPGEVTSAAFTLVDVAAFFGVATLDLGQVRVRQIGGTGTVWGVLTTIAADGSVRVSLGANP